MILEMKHCAMNKPTLKTIPISLLAIFAAAPLTPTLAQENVLDLTAPANYSQPSVPDYITKDNTPPDNPITNLGATLGRVLFYDRRLSRNDTISCSSCHRQQNAFGDPATASVGVAGTTGRHSMRLVNARFSNEERFFWDERATSAEDQASKPIQDHVEMGFSGTLGDPDFADLVDKLSAIEEYQVLFQGVFGDSEVTEERVQRTLAQFIRSIQSFDSKYDVGLAQAPNDAAPFANFTPQENAGKQLFRTPPPQGGAGCATCHQPPEFDIAPNSGNNGVSLSLGGGTDFTNTRAPTLRDLVAADGSPHSGFMHNAALPDLLAVVNHYNAIPAVVPGLDRRLLTPGPGGQAQRLNLTQAEKDDLIAFLRTLTGSNLYTDTKWADPFDKNGTLSFVVLPSDGMKLSLSSGDSGESGRNATISITGVPNVEYLIQSSIDMENWTSLQVTASALGEVTATLAAPTDTPRCFYRVSYVPDGSAPPAD
ncbi:MAG: cytochrome c peroxidase [Verrucomicrobiales bacterium]|jgi:cytochrome c peroxidase